MTDIEVDRILADILKLAKEDAPGQVHDAIYRLNILDGYELFSAIAGIAFLGNPKVGKEMTVKQAVAMVEV